MIYVYQNPYQDLAASVVTSNLIDQRDAFDVTISLYTTAGTASAFTVQLSNWSTNPDGVSATVGWSNWTTITPSVATVIQPPLGFRYSRILRTVSGSSLVFDINKQVNAGGR